MQIQDYFKIGFYDGYMIGSSDTVKDDWTEQQLEAYQTGYDKGVSLYVEQEGE